jgi:hypothetical protein
MMTSMQSTNHIEPSLTHEGGSGDRVSAGLGFLIAVQAASLGVMALLHLSGLLAGGSEPFDPQSAGVAEAAIGVILGAAAVTVWRAPELARLAAPVGVGFAVVGFVIGLTITAQGGDLTDVVYHATVLPLLVVTLLLLVRPHELGRRR